MAILSSVLDWHGFTGMASNDEVTYRERYQVTFDNLDDPRIRPMLAVDNTTVGPNPIPQRYTSHPYNSWLIVNNIEVEPSDRSPLLFVVVVTYSNRPIATSFESPFIYANPLEQPCTL